jgi:hypothetical protein
MPEQASKSVTSVNIQAGEACISPAVCGAAQLPQVRADRFNNSSTPSESLCVWHCGCDVVHLCCATGWNLRLMLLCSCITRASQTEEFDVVVGVS